MVSTNTKLAEALRKGRGLLPDASLMSDDELAWDLEAAAVLAEFDAAKGEAMNNDPDWLNNQSFRDQAAYEALAAHDAEQAQADDWQHLKPYGYAPGNYMSRCRTCGDTPVMDKRAITCRPCAEAKFAASQAQAERVGLTDEQIAEGRYLTWAAEPDDAPEAWSFMRGARWAEKHFGIGATTGKEPAP